ncbi:hypothetical protein RB195_015760 [Necator americanus]|uniref:SCP domain-containing protein n=1 Tax=Necator americanus TaxID=51031 RepID=A0ABR1E610_NECAM
MNPLLLTLFLASLQLYNNAVTSAAGFKCQNSLISDQWRKGILELINGFRRTVAKGEQLGKDDKKLPTAKKMNQLSWDCNIEAEAQAAAKTCPTSLTTAQLPAFQDTAYKLGYITATGTIKANSCDATKTAKDLLTQQWNTAVANQEDEKVARDAKAFAQLAHDEVSAFACTYQICQPTSYYLLCFFNQKAPTKDDVYTADAKGKYCSNATCTCVDGLCERTPKPALFKSTFCGTGKDACTGKFSDNFRRTALEMHNYYRRLLATGWAKSGDNYAKPATKMIELQYDKTLEDAAIKEIKDCKANLNNAVEKNFWSLDVTTSKNIGEDAIKKAVAKWWKPSGNQAFGGNRKNTNGLMSAANIAYDEATKVGCAIDAGAACLKLGKLYIMCKYDKSPAIGEEIYEAGNKACSKCGTTGTNPSCSPLGGLCV